MSNSMPVDLVELARFNQARDRNEEIHEAQPRASPHNPTEPSSSSVGRADAHLEISSTTRLTKWRVLSTCLMSFGNGLNDSSPGALIPYMESDYSIGYAIVSLIFVTNAIGFICAAPLTDFLQSKFGRARAYMVSEALMAAGYLTITCKPPYPLTVAAYFLIGLGEAFSLALNNVFCANVGDTNTALSYLHGSYGLGGTVGPLIATAIASNGASWYRFYYIAMAIVICNGCYAGYIFWGYQDDHHLHQIGSGTNQTRPRHVEAQNESLPPSAVAGAINIVPSLAKTDVLKLALRSSVTILGALFIFAYQGAEVSISGWVISFLVTYRHGDLSSVGYVTAGFWGGITVGRFALSPIAHRIGEKISVIFLTVGSLIFQILVWMVPSVVGNAVVVALIGLFLGPVYVCATAIFSRLLPRNLQIVSLGLISSAGSSGGALAPLVTGLVAQEKGTWVLHPICIGLYGAMLASWLGLPKTYKRRE